MKAKSILFICQGYLLFLLTAICPASTGRIIYVDDDAPPVSSVEDRNEGSSWENAYVYLQDALADANSADKPVEIRVAQGTYKPDQGRRQKRGDQGAEFQLMNNVAIMGSYAGIDATDPNIRNIDEYLTILSGDLNGDDIVVSDPCDMYSEPTRFFDNSSHVVESNNTNETAVLNGCIITGGYYRGGGRHFVAGAAGMINYSGSPTLVNCTFTGNASVMAGSGLCNLDEGNATLNGCTFNSNYNLIGGTIYNTGSNLTLTHCVFAGNHADYGGGVYNLSNLKLVYCSFIENSASRGGGVYNSGNIVLDNCQFIGNYAQESGGGTYNSNASKPVLTNCTFNGNSAKVGGGMLNRYNNTKLTSCTFRGNWADEGGGMFNYHSVTTLIENCIFSGNSAEEGGAIGSESSFTKLSNCIFKGNRADFGGGVYFSNSNSILANCLFYYNLGENGNALACSSYLYGAPNAIELTNCILWNDNNQIWNHNNSIITIAYSDIKGGQTSVYDPYQKVVWGAGNIDDDPCFIDPVNYDYHLKSQAGRWDPNSQSWVIDNVTSPCIDIGDPNTPVGYEPFPNGHKINMGVHGGTAEASMSLYEPVDYLQQATYPNPTDGAVDVILDVMSSWISDPNAVAHEIYFGASEFPPFLRKLYETEFDTGALKPNTRYYWRIDDIDALSNRTIGHIWTFLTGPQPARAYNPSPFNGFEDIAAYSIVLTWNPGLNAVAHNVYLGTDFNDVYQSTVGNPLGVLVSVAQEPNYFNPGDLEFEQTYYWRIDEIDDKDIITPGNIWTFTTGSHPVQAYNPNPPDGTMNVSPEVIISWSLGKNAVSHDVYFGFTYPPEFVRNQIETEYDPPGLLPTQAQCYWRIDEIDDQGNIIPGKKWRFKVHEYKGRFCFTGETCVWIGGVAIPISKVAAGQSIGSLDISGIVETVQEHEGIFACYDIVLESGNSITVAENHFFMAESGQWLSLHDLKAGSGLKTAKATIGVKTITKQPKPYVGKVYNLKIEGSDQYTVGKDALIVRDY